MKEKENVKTINGKYGKAEFVDQKTKLPKEVAEGDYFRMALLGVMRSTKNSIYIIGNQLKEISEKLDSKSSNGINNQDNKEYIKDLHNQIIKYSLLAVNEESNFKEKVLKEMIIKYTNLFYDNKNLSFIDMKDNFLELLCDILSVCCYETVKNRLVNFHFRNLSYGDSCNFNVSSKQVMINNNICSMNDNCYVIPPKSVELRFNGCNWLKATFAKIYSECGIKSMIENISDKIESYIISKINEEYMNTMIIFDGDMYLTSEGKVKLSIGIGQEIK